MILESLLVLFVLLESILVGLLCMCEVFACVVCVVDSVCVFFILLFVGQYSLVILINSLSFVKGIVESFVSSFSVESMSLSLSKSI